MSERHPPVPEWVTGDLVELERDQLLRRRIVVSRPKPGWIRVDGRDYIDFASNDYLGLAGDPAVRQASIDAVAEHGWGSAASPLLAGYHPLHEQLERELASFENAESVLLFGSGFSANVAILAALAGPQDVVFCDKRNHASLIDGCRLSRAAMRVYRTAELETLDRRLAAAAGFRHRFIVTDSVFSMDGDIAPLADLCAIAERRDAILYVDDAHATGVLGEHGRGAAELFGVEHRVPLRLGTLSKALGGVGGFLVAAKPWRDWLVNHARGYIYSTAIPPAAAAAALAALRLLQAQPDRRTQVHRLSDAFRKHLSAAGFGCRQSATPIVPVLLGSVDLTIRLTHLLREQGFWTAPIRPPTVPIGTSRLRVSFSTSHDRDAVQHLASLIVKLAAPNRLPDSR